jgi:2,4-dienoyl-CoA reductase-like NADH-dependent reductase (Old Yellow Enzyme family)
MTNQQSAADGTLGEQELAWLQRRAEGGFGVVTTCAVHVSRTGQGWPNELGAWGEQHLPGLTRLAGAIGKAGALGLVQLFHGGARCPTALTGVRPVSAVDRFPPGETGKVDLPRAATEGELLEIVGNFAAAARRVEQAGWGGVEIHGAHGYLLAQFLSRRYNDREDSWGGDLAGRARLLKEVVRAVRQATGPGFVVGVRLSPRTYEGDGRAETADCLRVAAQLWEEKIDFLHASLWDAFRREEDAQPGEPTLLEQFREALPVECPLVVAGGVRGRADVDYCRALGADAVAIGKPAIAFADWPRRVRADPEWSAPPPPYTVEHLRGQAVGESFITYLKRWQGFVAE